MPFDAPVEADEVVMDVAITIDEAAEARAPSADFAASDDGDFRIYEAP
jgi:hypothetical protein